MCRRRQRGQDCLRVGARAGAAGGVEARGGRRPGLEWRPEPEGGREDPKVDKGAGPASWDIPSRLGKGGPQARGRRAQARGLAPPKHLARCPEPPAAFHQEKRFL